MGPPEAMPESNEAKRLKLDEGKPDACPEPAQGAQQEQATDATKPETSDTSKAAEDDELASGIDKAVGWRGREIALASKALRRERYERAKQSIEIARSYRK